MDMIPHVHLNQMKDILRTLYMMGNRQSVLLLGAPGIGKSESIEQIARELAEINQKKFIKVEFRWEGGELLDYSNIFRQAVEILKNPDNYFTFLDIRLTEYEPTDLQGIPRDFTIEDLKVFDYVPFIWQLIVSSTAGITLFDEITNVSRPDTRAIMYKLLRDRKAGWITFHPDQFIVAAGNTPDDAAIASMLDAPIINRVRVFRVEPPTVDEWAEYMNKYVEDWDTRVYAFLKRFSKFFFQKPNDVETLDPFATPRQWTELAKVSHYFDDETLEYIAYSNVGSEAAAHFMTFIKTNVPDVEEILKKPELIASFDIDAKYLVAAQIASAIQKEFSDSKKSQINKFVRVLSWLHQYDRELLQLVTVMCGGKAMRKLHTTCLTVSALRPVAQFFAETTKMMWEAGV